MEVIQGIKSWVNNGQPKDVALISYNARLNWDANRDVPQDEILLKTIEPLVEDKIRQKNFDRYLNDKLRPYVEDLLAKISNVLGINGLSYSIISDSLVTEVSENLTESLKDGFPGVDLDSEINRIEQIIERFKQSFNSSSFNIYLRFVAELHWLRILRKREMD